MTEDNWNFLVAQVNDRIFRALPEKIEQQPKVISYWIDGHSWSNGQFFWAIPNYFIRAIDYGNCWKWVIESF
jgi:hypothetical protein